MKIHTTPAAIAKQWILKGNAPENMVVSGELNLSGQKNLRSLPKNLTCSSLDISETALLELPTGLKCNQFKAQRIQIRALPDDVQIRFRLDLAECELLEYLPKNLTVGSLVLRECIGLKQLPEGLDTSFLDLTGCVQLESFPNQGKIGIGHLILRGCTRLTALPNWLGQLAQLDLAGCEQITQLPKGVQISSWLDLADTSISNLEFPNTKLRWRGVNIESRIAFEPESISATEIMNTENLELRRVKLERMGYEKFLTEVDAKVLDTDQDTGGTRKLLRVPFQNDEDFVAVWVICPSTKRNYVLRVPPTTKTCHQAAAWLAGYDNPNDYAPRLEA
jgi:hypothetical protein